MAVTLGSRVEAAGQFVLGFWRAVALVFEKDDVGVVEGVADEVEVVVCVSIVSFLL